MPKVLEVPTGLVITQEEQIQYEENRKYCNKYFYVFHLIYCNPIFGNIFFNKKKDFLRKMDSLFDLNQKKIKIFKYKVAQAIAFDNYRLNEQFAHYTFWVEGKSYTYGILEIDPDIFETAKFLKEQKEQKNTNVISIFKNKK